MKSVPDAGPSKKIYEVFKRGLDFLLAFLAGMAALVLLPFIAAAIKLEAGGPILFRQRRVGKDGKIFLLLKLRSTWRTQVDETIGWSKDEEHVYTRVGKFLRKSYLDELPQVLNVLTGEMSFIGPRPERPEFVEVLKKKVPRYGERLAVRPGLTGWAQINMENDAAAEDAAEKLRYDLYYIEHRSLGLDLYIAVKTLLMIARRQGR